MQPVVEDGEPSGAPASGAEGTGPAATVAVIGPGAIGGAIAGALVQAGHRPLVCARTRFTELIVDHPGGRISALPDCYTSPRQLAHPDRSVASPGDVDVSAESDPAAPVEVVILAVKAHQTAGAERWLRSLVGPQTMLVVAQNGVEHRPRVQPLIGSEVTVVPAVIWCPADRSAPGRIRVTGGANLVVPKGPGGHRLAELLEGSFFGVRLSEDFTTRAWDKLMINAALGGLGVLTGRTGSDLAREPVLRDLMLRLMAEIVVVARAEGAVVADDRPERILDAMVAAGTDHLSSIAVDRREGRPTEWDARNAVIGRFAARHGLDAPLNEWLTALIRFGEPRID